MDLSSSNGFSNSAIGTKVSLGKDAKLGVFETAANIDLSSYYLDDSNAFKAYITNAKGTVYGESLKFTLPVVSIQSMRPLVGKAGDKITILGKNLSTEKSAYVVKFNNTEAIVLDAYKDSIRVQVPSTINSNSLL